MSEIILTRDNFRQEVLEASLPVVVDFYATWCAPCRMLAPILATAAQELDGQVGFGIIDIDDQPELAEAYHVKSIPTVKVFKNGKEISSHTGYLTREKLMQMIR